MNAETRIQHAQRSPENPLPAPAHRALTFALLISALRCTIQYVVLPFVLPWIGLAASIPPWLTLVLGGVALASLTRNVNSLWRLHHPQRWSYLALAFIVATALVLFMVMDVRTLLGP
jgi:ABC-type iron transport system FetAB permease component